MGVVGALDEDEYWPEFGAVVIRDAVTDVDVRWPSFPLLDEDRRFWGTVARAGECWLQLNSGEQPQRVRIEAHDAEPAPDDGVGWGDVLETPYRCWSAAVGFTTTTSGPAQTGLPLGGPGDYRVRVCRRPAHDAGDIWVVRFWPAPVRPPRWLVRDRERHVDSSAVADDLFALVSWERDAQLTATVTELAGWTLLDPAAIGQALPDLSGNGAKVERRGDTVILTAGILQPREDEWELVEQAPAEEPAPSSDKPAWRVAYEREQNEHRLRNRPPSGAPPRLGYLVGPEVVLSRGGEPVTIARCPLDHPSSAVEVAHGVLINGGNLRQTNTVDDRTVLARWDGGVEQLGNDLRRLRISRDGTVAGAHEIRGVRRPVNRLHLIDLSDGSRRSLELSDDMADFELRVTGVTRDAIWFTTRRQPVQMWWSVGSAAPEVAPGPPPAAGWEGPTAPIHPFYATPGAGRWCDNGGRSADLHEADGVTRSYPLPSGGQGEDGSLVWEDADNVLMKVGPTSSGGVEYLGCLFRLDVRSETWQTASTDPGIGMLIWPWPHRPPTCTTPTRCSIAWARG